MAFADEVVKPYSERYCYIKYSYTWTSTGWTSLGSNLYSLAVSGNVDSVDSRTLVSGNPTSNSEYSYDGTTMTIYSFPILVPPEITFSFYITDDVETELPSSITTGDNVIWENRLKESPTIIRSLSNIYSDSLTTPSIKFSIENSDLAYNAHFGSDRDYYDKTVVVWFKVNTEFEKQFTGYLRTLDFTGTTIVVGAIDSSSVLDDPCLMGDSESDSYYSNYTVHERNETDVVPMIVGRTGIKVENTNTVTHTVTSGTTHTREYSLPNPRIGAVCTDYSAGDDTTNTNNREWTLCRTLNQSLDDVDFGTITSLYESTASGTFSAAYNGSNTALCIAYTSGDHTCEPGHSGYLDNSTAKQAFLVIESGSGYFRFIMPGTTALGYGTGDIKANITFPYTIKDIKIRVQQGSTTSYACQNYGATTADFSITETALASGNKLIKITFEDDCESHSTLKLNTINPESTRVSFELKLAGQVKVGTLIQEIMEGNGLTVDSTSVTTINTTYTSDYCVTAVPLTEATEVPSARQTLARALGAIKGFIRVDADDTWYMFNMSDVPPANSTDHTRTDDDVLQSSVIPRINYYNTNTAEFIVNPALEPGEGNFQLTRDSSTKYRTRTIYSVFQDSSEGGGYINNDGITYQYATDAMDLTTELGDTVDLNVSNTLEHQGASKTVLVVVEVRKSTKNVVVTGLFTT